MRRLPRRTELLADRLEGRGVLVVTVHVAQQSAQLRKRRAREPAVLFQTLLGPGPELIDAPAGLGHADHRHSEVAALQHRLQRREDLLVRQVAGGAKKHQGVGMGGAHVAAAFSRCPPNSYRSAESSLSAKSASPR